MKANSTFAIIMVAMLVLAAQMAGAQGKSEGPEQVLLQSANRERAAQGLAPLKWDTALAEAAKQHASQMARENTLSHQLPGEPDMKDRATRAGARFSALAENVAEGPSAENIHQQWMKSPPHRANLLDPQLDSVGISVAQNNGTLFAVEDFSLAAGGLSISEQEKLVSAQLEAQGLHLLSDTDDARRSCLLDNGYAGTHTPSFVLHYATSDLQTLPDMLEQRIRTNRYHSAAVGACSTGNKAGLSGYHVAVLLYE